MNRFYLVFLLKNKAILYTRLIVDILDTILNIEFNVPLLIGIICYLYKLLEYHPIYSLE